MRLNRKGFTLVEIMIVVAIIALLAAIAIPSFSKSRNAARLSSCINNMRLIQHAKEQWATTNSKLDTDTAPVTDINAYLKNAPTCPSGGTYTYGTVATTPTCSKAASPDYHVAPAGL